MVDQAAVAEQGITELQAASVEDSPQNFDATKLHNSPGELARESISDQVLGILSSDAPREDQARQITDMITGYINLGEVDQATGLLNKRGLYRLLNAEVGRAKRERKRLQDQGEVTEGMKLSVKVIFMDLNLLKDFNDTFHSHGVGDRLVDETAESIKTSSRRPTDFHARYGGDEFVTILPNTDTQGALTWWMRAYENFQRRGISVAAGLAELDVDKWDPDPNNWEDALDAVLHDADDAMYIAKAQLKKRESENPTNLLQEPPPSNLLDVEGAKNVELQNPGIRKYNDKR